MEKKKYALRIVKNSRNVLLAMRHLKKIFKIVLVSSYLCYNSFKQSISFFIILWYKLFIVFYRRLSLHRIRLLNSGWACWGLFGPENKSKLSDLLRKRDGKIKRVSRWLQGLNLSKKLLPHFSRRLGKLPMRLTVPM